MNMRMYFGAILLLLMSALPPGAGRSRNRASGVSAACNGGEGRKEIVCGADQPGAYLPYLKGKRVGILGNRTSIIGGKSIVDSLLTLGVNIRRIFGPEHGFRGNASNGAKVG